MRAPPFPPTAMPHDLRPLHDEMAEYIKEHLKGFVSKRAHGALIGPFAPMRWHAQFGRCAWGYLKSLIDNTKLPKPAQEVAILATGGASNSRYELYSHERVAGSVGLAADKIATIASGQRPADLSNDEAVAYDIATVLARCRQLPESTYQRSIKAFEKAFEEEQTAEMIYIVCGYALVSLLLNAYDMSVPSREERLPSDSRESVS